MTLDHDAVQAIADAATLDLDAVRARAADPCATFTAATVGLLINHIDDLAGANTYLTITGEQANEDLDNECKFTSELRAQLVALTADRDAARNRVAELEKEMAEVHKGLGRVLVDHARLRAELAEARAVKPPTRCRDDEGDHWSPVGDGFDAWQCEECPDIAPMPLAHLDQTYGPLCWCLGIAPAPVGAGDEEARA